MQIGTSSMVSEGTKLSTFGGQEIKGMKIDLESEQRHHSRPFWAD